MIAALRHPVVVDPAEHFEGPSAARVDPVAAFRLRAECRAFLWSVGEYDLHEAVDVLQSDAAFTGLIFKIGQDRVQAILRDAFHPFRDAA